MPSVDIRTSLYRYDYMYGLGSTLDMYMYM